MLYLNSMLKNLKSAKIYSKKDKKLVDWTVEQTKETDEGGNEEDIILVKHGTEIQRYSPTYTDEELQKAFDDINKENA